MQRDGRGAHDLAATGMVRGRGMSSARMPKCAGGGPESVRQTGLFAASRRVVIPNVVRRRAQRSRRAAQRTSTGRATSFAVARSARTGDPAARRAGTLGHSPRTPPQRVMSVPEGARSSPRLDEQIRPRGSSPIGSRSRDGGHSEASRAEVPERRTWGPSDAATVADVARWARGAGRRRSLIPSWTRCGKPSIDQLGPEPSTDADPLTHREGRGASRPEGKDCRPACSRSRRDVPPRARPPGRFGREPRHRALIQRVRPRTSVAPRRCSRRSALSAGTDSRNGPGKTPPPRRSGRPASRTGSVRSAPPRSTVHPVARSVDCRSARGRLERLAFRGETGGLRAAQNRCSGWARGPGKFPGGSSRRFPSRRTAAARKPASSTTRSLGSAAVAPTLNPRLRGRTAGEPRPSSRLLSPSTWAAGPSRRNHRSGPPRATRTSSALDERELPRRARWRFSPSRPSYIIASSEHYRAPFRIWASMLHERQLSNHWFVLMFTGGPDEQTFHPGSFRPNSEPPWRRPEKGVWR